MATATVAVVLLHLLLVVMVAATPATPQRGTAASRPLLGCQQAQAALQPLPLVEVVLVVLVPAAVVVQGHPPRLQHQQQQQEAATRQGRPATARVLASAAASTGCGVVGAAGGERGECQGATASSSGAAVATGYRR